MGHDRQGWMELLGPGDVISPRMSAQEEPLAHSHRWRVLTPTAVAILDGRFRLAVARWPQIASAVIERVTAVRHLDERGLLTRTGDGGWLLLGPRLRDVEEAVARAAGHPPRAAALSAVL